MTKRMRGNLLLLLTAIIWGTSFVAQTEGTKYIAPFTFIGIRSMLAGIALAIFLSVRHLVTGKKQPKEAVPEKQKEDKKVLFVGGLCCGLVLFAASMLQQVGIFFSPASGKAGFITALYLILVPLCGIFVKKKIGGRVWFAVVLAVFGMYLLCITERFTVSKGDGFLLLCSVAFTAHILVIDRFSPRTDGVAMSCIQFFVCGSLACAGMLLFEPIDPVAIAKAAIPLLYSGVMSGGVAYTLQIVAQKDTDPTMASLLMSLESVFAVLGGFVILGERLSGREIAGCTIMFAAIILTQLPEKGKRSGCCTIDKNML